MGLVAELFSSDTFKSAISEVNRSEAAWHVIVLREVMKLGYRRSCVFLHARREKKLLEGNKKARARKRNPQTETLWNSATSEPHVGKRRRPLGHDNNSRWGKKGRQGGEPKKQPPSSRKTQQRYQLV